MHQEIGLTPSPTFPSRARWSPQKARCGRSGNKTGSQPRVSPPRRRTEGGFSDEIQSGPIATLIRSRMTELGLSRGELSKRLGYKNIAKGSRMDALCDGDLEGTIHFLDVLPQALEISAETVKRALDQTVRELELAEEHEAEARDKIWRENFCPHAIILTERTVPSPIFVAAIIGVEKLLRIDLDPTQGPVSYVRQVLDRLPEGVPAFGKPIGFVINYSPDKAVRFDSNGHPIAILDKAVRPGTAVLLRLGGRPIPAEALGLVFGR